MPVKDDCISAAKVEEFDEYVKAAGSELLQGRIHKLKLPYHNSFGRRDTYMEQLLWGELGDYVRQRLRGGRPEARGERGREGRRIRYADGKWGK